MDGAAPEVQVQLARKQRNFIERARAHRALVLRNAQREHAWYVLCHAFLVLLLCIPTDWSGCDNALLRHLSLCVCIRAGILPSIAAAHPTCVASNP